MTSRREAILQQRREERLKHQVYDALRGRGVSVGGSEETITRFLRGYVEAGVFELETIVNGIYAEVSKGSQYPRYDLDAPGDGRGTGGDVE